MHVFATALNMQIFFIFRSCLALSALLSFLSMSMHMLLSRICHMEVNWEYNLSMLYSMSNNYFICIFCSAFSSLFDGISFRCWWEKKKWNWYIVNIILLTISSVFKINDSRLVHSLITWNILHLIILYLWHEVYLWHITYPRVVYMVRVRTHTQLQTEWQRYFAKYIK